MMQVELLYFGRTSEFLMMTSERLLVSEQVNTLAKVLGELRQRGAAWAYELAEGHVLCTVDGESKNLSAEIRDGNEIGVFSMRSMCEP